MSAATINVFGREAEVVSVDNLTWSENIDGSPVYVAEIQIKINGKRFPNSVIIEADLITLHKNDVEEDCAICREMQPLQCDRHFGRI